MLKVHTSVIPSIEYSRRVRLGDLTGGFFVGKRGERCPSWFARESLGDFLNSMFILYHKEYITTSDFIYPPIIEHLLNFESCLRQTEEVLQLLLLHFVGNFNVDLKQ